VGGAGCRWQIRVVDGGYGLSMGGAGLVVGWCWVVAGLAGLVVDRRWTHWSSLGATHRWAVLLVLGMVVVLVGPLWLSSPL